LAAALPPAGRRIRVDLTLPEAGHPLALVQEQLRVVLGDARLRIEEGQPEATLDAQARVEIGTVLDRLPVADILQEALDLGQVRHGDDLDVHGGRHGCCVSLFLSPSPSRFLIQILVPANSTGWLSSRSGCAH